MVISFLLSVINPEETMLTVGSNECQSYKKKRG